MNDEPLFDLFENQPCNKQIFKDQIEANMERRMISLEQRLERLEPRITDVEDRVSSTELFINSEIEVMRANREKNAKS